MHPCSSFTIQSNSFCDILPINLLIAGLFRLIVTELGDSTNMNEIFICDSSENRDFGLQKNSELKMLADKWKSAEILYQELTTTLICELVEKSKLGKNGTFGCNSVKIESFEIRKRLTKLHRRSS